MGKTIAEKILGRASGMKTVEPSDFITAKIDLHYNLEGGMAEVHDTVVGAGLPDGLPKVSNPNIIAIMLGDHKGCHGTYDDVQLYKISRDLAKRYGIEKLYEINKGIAHVTVPEEGLVRPGMLVCGKDSHSTTPGACNALATGVSAIETAWIYMTGELWFRVPESIKFTCKGKLSDGVVAKDIFLYVIGKYSPSMATYKSLEWKGPLIDGMGMDGRFTLACLSLELGAKFAPFEPDATCLEYIKSTSAEKKFASAPADRDAEYEKVYEEDFSDLEPQVALPHGFEIVKPVSEVEGVKVDQCNLGSCADGRYDDLAIAARILKRKKIKSRAIFAPGSWRVYNRALKTGVLETLVEAGVVIMAPSCMPCAGRAAALADGEVAVGATPRNFRGRYGSPNAEIYLASTATAAASAVTGKLTDPRDLL